MRETEQEQREKRSPAQKQEVKVCLVPGTW